MFEAKAEYEGLKGGEQQRLGRQPRAHSQIDVEWAKILVCCSLAGYGLRIDQSRVRVCLRREADLEVNLPGALATVAAGRELGLGCRILLTAGKAEAIGVESDEAWRWSWLESTPMMVDKRTTVGKRWLELQEMLPPFNKEEFMRHEPKCPECGKAAGYGERHDAGCSEPRHPWPSHEAYERHLKESRQADRDYKPTVEITGLWTQPLVVKAARS